MVPQPFHPDPALFADAEALRALCMRHHIIRLSLFGSRLSGQAHPDSDVDLLVQFAFGKEPGLIGLSRIAEELSGLLGGATVDLRTLDDLSLHFRADVELAARVQYAA